MGKRLEGKVAIITGSTSGIGRATAKLFAEEGAKVIVNGRRAELGEQVVQEIKEKGGEAFFFQADISQKDQLRALINSADETYGRLDILVNNAWSGKIGSILDLTDKDWEAGIAVSLNAVYLGCKYAIPLMTRGGGGSIINISSVHGLLASRHYLPYDAVKAGLIQMTRQIALDYGEQGIRVNAICPGWIIIERSEDIVQEHPKWLRLIKALYPVGRPGYPIDVAKAALFLASDDSAFITGHALVVDGGLTTQLQDSAAWSVVRTLAEDPSLLEELRRLREQRRQQRSQKGNS